MNVKGRVITIEKKDIGKSFKLSGEISFSCRHIFGLTIVSDKNIKNCELTINVNEGKR